MFAGPSGFYNTPGTKGAMIVVAVSSVLASVLNLRGYTTLHGPSLIGTWPQIWRLATSQVVFLSPTEVLLGLVLMYHFRSFERRWGTQRYLAMIASVAALASLIQVGVLVALRTTLGVSVLIPGPYGVLFALLTFYWTDVPVGHQTTVAGVRVVDKGFFYLLAAQLALANAPHSLLAAATGVAAGALYRSDLGGVKSRPPPAAVVGVCRRFLAPLLASPEPRRRRQHTGRDFLEADAGGDGLDRGGGGGGEGEPGFRIGDMLAGGGPEGGGGGGGGGANGGEAPDELAGVAAPPPDIIDPTQEVQNLMWAALQARSRGRGLGGMIQSGSQPVPVHEEDVALLMGMGFTRARVVAALQATHNSVEHATNILLDATAAGGDDLV